ncbi:MAG: glycosyltransferase family 4 protein [Bacillota bacterium]
MKICFLSSMHPPLDKRVFQKEAVSLAKAGFDVTHLAPSDGYHRWEQDGVKIVTYPRPAGLIGRLLQLPRLYLMAAQIEADCYHCNEVDSWFVGVMLKRFRQKILVFDVHEHYPSTFAEGRFPLLLRSPVAGLVRAVLRSLAPITDRLVLAKRSVALDFTGYEQRLVLVQNFARLSAGTTKREHINVAAITLVHLGLMDRQRGWPELLDALVIAKSKSVRVHIIGAFDDGSEPEFHERARHLGLTDRIRVERWLPFEEAYSYLIASDVGLVLFQPGIQNNVWALPHKLFDYMLAGLPVIVPGFTEEVSTIVKEADCGLLVDSTDPGSIAAAIDGLATDFERRRKLGENGRSAVLELYNWETEAAKLIRMYTELGVSTSQESRRKETLL